MLAGCFLPCDVLTQDIEFQVDDTAGMNSGYISMFVGIWNDSDGEFSVGNIENSQADTIEADGAFFHDKTSELGREAEAVFPATILRGAGEAFAGGVYVALYDVPVYAAIEEHGSFQIYFLTWSKQADIAFLEGFGNGYDLVDIFVNVGNCEANPIVGDALVYFQFWSEGGADGDDHIAAFLFCSYNFA